MWDIIIQKGKREAVKMWLPAVLRILKAIMPHYIFCIITVTSKYLMVSLSTKSYKIHGYSTGQQHEGQRSDALDLK